MYCEMAPLRSPARLIAGKTLRAHERAPGTAAGVRCARRLLRAHPRTLSSLFTFPLSTYELHAHIYYIAIDPTYRAREKNTPT